MIEKSFSKLFLSHKVGQFKWRLWACKLNYSQSKMFEKMLFETENFELAREKDFDWRGTVMSWVDSVAQKTQFYIDTSST